jgi:hypothetical protein
VYSYGYGWPASYGTTWFPSCGSVWTGAPFGGTFFSGAVVPYPTISYPVVVPGFFGSNAAAAPAVATLAAARPAAHGRFDAGRRLRTAEPAAPDCPAHSFRRPR